MISYNKTDLRKASFSDFVDKICPSVRIGQMNTVMLVKKGSTIQDEKVNS